MRDISEIRREYEEWWDGYGNPYVGWGLKLIIELLLRIAIEVCGENGCQDGIANSVYTEKTGEDDGIE